MNMEKDFYGLELGLLNRKRLKDENGPASSTNKTKTKNDESLESDDNYEDESDHDVYVGYDAFIDTVNFFVALVSRHWPTTSSTISSGHYNQAQSYKSEKSKDSLMDHPSTQESHEQPLYLNSSTNQGFDSDRYNDAIQREIFRTEYATSSHSQSSSSFSSSNINAYNDGMGISLKNTSTNDFENNINDDYNEDVEDHRSLLLPRDFSTTSLRSMSSVSSTGECIHSNQRPPSRLPSLASLSQSLSASMPLPPPSSSPSSSSNFMKRISSMTNISHHQSKIGVDALLTEELDAQALRFGSRSRTSSL